EGQRRPDQARLHARTDRSGPGATHRRRHVRWADERRRHRARRVHQAPPTLQRTRGGGGVRRRGGHAVRALTPVAGPYRWCGLRLDADFDFPELLPGTDPGAPTWRITVNEGRAPSRPDRRWFNRWRFPDGRRWVAFARDPEGYILRFPELGDFDVKPEARRI